MATVAERVQKGARLLDRTRPGWERLINLNDLRLESTCNCVLGQLYGDYGKGVEELLHGDDYKAGNCGFNASGGIRYTALTREWLRTIFKRIVARLTL